MQIFYEFLLTLIYEDYLIGIRQETGKTTPVTQLALVRFSGILGRKNKYFTSRYFLKF